MMASCYAPDGSVGTNTADGEGGETVAELLPNPADIASLWDEDLEDISEGLYECFETMRRRVEADGLDREEFESLVQPYTSVLGVNKEVLDCLTKAADPNSCCIVTRLSLCGIFPVILRLVQIRFEEEAALQRRLKAIAAEAEAAANVDQAPFYASWPKYAQPTCASYQKINKEEALSARRVGRKHDPARRCSSAASLLASLSPPPERLQSLEALCIRMDDLVGMRMLFDEVDYDKDGFVTWAAFWGKSRGILPKHPPSRHLGLDSNTPFDWKDFIRLLYPGVTLKDAINLAKLHDDTVNRKTKFVLSKDQRAEIEYVFGLMKGEHPFLLRPHELVLGLVKLKHEPLKVARAFIKLCVTSSQSKAASCCARDIDLERFTNWYVEDILLRPPPGNKTTSHQRKPRRPPARRSTIS